MAPTNVSCLFIYSYRCVIYALQAYSVFPRMIVLLCFKFTHTLLYTLLWDNYLHTTERLMYLTIYTVKHTRF